MRNKEIKLCYILTNMSTIDKILMILLKEYTYRILKKGIDIGFNWEKENKECNYIKITLKNNNKGSK